MRPRGMAAEPFKHDLEDILGRHDRAGTGLEMTDRQAGHVVQAKNLIEGKALHQPIVEHGECPPAPFLGRLEDEAHGAVETALTCQQLCRAEQHGGVAVMAAGMHDARIAGSVGCVRLL